MLFGMIIFIISVIMFVLIKIYFAFVVYLILDDSFYEISLKSAIESGVRMINVYKFKFIAIQLTNIISTIIVLNICRFAIVFIFPLYGLFILNLYKESRNKYFKM